MVNYVNGTTPAVNSTNLNKMQTDLQINITNGTEKTTNMTLGGKQIYVKRIDCGYAPNNSEKQVQHGLTNVSFVKIEGIAIANNGNIYPLPFAYNDNARIAIWINNQNIEIQTWHDKSNFHCYVDLYYTKN